MDAIREQKKPKGKTPVTDLVIKDLQARAKVGTEKYGESLKTFNGRDALVDAYQEALDLAQYLKQEIEERRVLNAKLEGYENYCKTHNIKIILEEKT